jgi:hypothetical protein
MNLPEAGQTAKVKPVAKTGLAAISERTPKSLKNRYFGFVY